MSPPLAIKLRAEQSTPYGVLVQVMKEIVHAAQQHQHDVNVGAIIITGEGTKAFAAGADIKEMANQSYSQVRCLCRLMLVMSHSCVVKDSQRSHRVYTIAWALLGPKRMLASH